MKNRPNILFINTDQQRADTLSYLGNNHINTPNLDKLCEEGVCFENMHCVHPICSPSRVSWQTGKYIHTHGYWENGCDTNSDEIFQAQVLRDNGYHTALIGKSHLSPTHGNVDNYLDSHQMVNGMKEQECEAFWSEKKGNYHGFEDVRLAPGHGERVLSGGHFWVWIKKNHPEYMPLFTKPEGAKYSTWDSKVPAEVHPDRWITNEAIKYLEEQTNDKPFFLWVGYQQPHMPYCPPVPYDKACREKDMVLPIKGGNWVDNPNYLTEYYLNKGGANNITDNIARKIVANYYSSIVMIDHEVGTLLDTLKGKNLEKNTVIIFTSDHGDWLGDHGLWLKGAVHTRGVTQIPFIIKWKDKLPTGKKIKNITSQIDLASTIYELCELEEPFGVQGKSLLGTICKDEELPRDYAFIEHRLPAFRDGSIYAKRYSLSNEERNSKILNPFNEDIHIKTVVTDEYRITYIPKLDYGELFDLKKDQDELTNVWNTNLMLRQKAMHKLIEVLIQTEGKGNERKSIL